MMKGRLIPPSQKAFLHQQKDTADRLPNRTELSTQWIMRPPWVRSHPKTKISRNRQTYRFRTIHKPPLEKIDVPEPVVGFI
jgi:hypothetical protein